MITLVRRNFGLGWIQWIGTVCSILVVILRQPERVSAWQPQRMFTLMAVADKGSNYHRYQPPVKTSVMKQLMQGRISNSVGSNSGGTLNGGSDAGPASGAANIANGGTSRPSTAQAAFAGSISLPPPSFEQRMRDMVLGKPLSQAQSSARGVAKRSLPANVQVIETLQDYKVVVGDERQKIVAVRFYATYCKACQAVAPHFYRLASHFPNVKFIDVPVTERNAALHQGLGIPTLPFAHIYHPMGGLVEEQKFTRKHVHSFEEKLSSYVVGSCPIPAEPISAIDECDEKSIR